MSYDDNNFIAIYDKYFSSFQQTARGHIAKYLAAQRSDRLAPVLLDLCCGTGQLAAYFAGRGYRVFGIDGSAAMLAAAHERVARIRAEGKVILLQGDATDFELPEPVSFATATTNALCSIPDLNSLAKCLACVRAGIRDGGTFVFDMNTISGMQRTNLMILNEFEDEFFSIKTIFDAEHARTFTRTSGFLRLSDEDGSQRWERFENTAVETAYQVDDILSAVRQAGWSEVWPAGLLNLAEPLADPEAAERCFYVAVA